MKKLLLPLFAATLVSSMFAQTAIPSSSLLCVQQDQVVPRTGRVVLNRNQTQSQNLNTERTTTGGYRWYDYTYTWHNAHAPFEMYLDSLNRISLSANLIALNYAQPLWMDTSSILGYATSSGGYVYNYNPYTSSGLTSDPQMHEWNRLDSFYGEIAITPGDSYTIDSIQIIGWYHRNYVTTYKRNVVDTLVVTFVQGNTLDRLGSSFPDLPIYNFAASADILSDFGLAGNLKFVIMAHDSINNRAGHYMIGDTITAPPYIYTGTTTGPIYKFPLNLNDTNSSDGLRGTTFPRPGHTITTDEIIDYVVEMGNQVGVSVSFISGDTGYHSVHRLTIGLGANIIGDTLRYVNGSGVVTGYKYGEYEIGYAYNSTDGTAAHPAYPPYMALSDSDWTDGFFKREGPGMERGAGWGGFYECLWAFGAILDIGTPSPLQYPQINFHTECATCQVLHTWEGIDNLSEVISVRAFPDPAFDELNIFYRLKSISDIAVTLTNMLGQVVAVQKMENTSAGTIVFNTELLPDGIYIYTFEADGERRSGRAVVSH